jgi:hypothetical protein
MSNRSRPLAPRSLMWTRPLIVGVLVLISFASVQPDEQIWHGMVPLHAADPQVESSQPNGESPSVVSQRTKERQIKAYSGLFALVGILIAGLAMAALIVLWAGRLRRQIRRPLPECGAPVRDFWFLKPPKPSVTETSLPDSHLPLHEQPPDHPPSRQSDPPTDDD